MAAATPFDPKNSSVSAVQYVTATAGSPAFATAYGEANQTLTEMSPKGTKVQAGSLAAWT
jgi:hypothetical protein